MFRHNSELATTIHNEYEGPFNTLGREVVESNIDVVASQVDPEWDPNPENFIFAPPYEPLPHLQQALKKVRSDLRANLSVEENRRDLNRYLNNDQTDVPVMFSDWRDEANQSWSKWLVNTDDEKLVNFLQWHNYHTLEVQNSPKIQAEINQQREEYKTAIAGAIDAGDLPPSATRAINCADETNIYIGDIFDTLMQDRTGYHYPYTNFIVVDADSIQEVTKHELNHVPFRLAYTWANEAMTEHVAQSLEKGGFDDFDIGGAKGHAYESERRLMDAIAQIITDHVLESHNMPLGRYDEIYAQVMRDFVFAYTDDVQPDMFMKRVEDLLGAAMQARGIRFIGRSFFRVDRTITRQYKTNLENGSDERTAMEHAMDTVRSDLLQQPEFVFGGSLFEDAA